MPYRIAGATVAATAMGLVAQGTALAADEELETIVVTSNKRAQDELSVPASISVLSEDSLSRNHVANIEDLGRTMPNVAVAQFGDGQYRLIYRGLGATGTSDNQNFNVAYDGTIVPYGNAYRLLDLARVEVSRGPQGTLYGRNTNAGVINIVPHDGTTDEPAMVEGYYGSADTKGLRAAFGGPVDNSDFFFRLAAAADRSDGYISNVTLHRDDTDEHRSGTLRATAGWRDDLWTIKSSLTYDRYYGLADDLTPETTPYRSIAADVGTSSGHLMMPTLTASYQGPGYTVTAVTAYANTSRLLDFSAVVSPLLFGQFDRRNTLSQEFRVAGDNELFGLRTNWVTGLYLLNENDHFTSTLTLTHPGVTPLTFQNQQENTRSAALFGEAVTNWSEHWQTTAGLRVAAEHQRYEYELSAAGAQLHSSKDYPAVQPKFAASFILDPQEQMYASVTRGFRAGAVFVNNAAVHPDDPSYKQESTWQYELGYKARLAQDRIEISTAVFYIDWTDLQVQRSILSVAPAGVFSVVDNASKAKSRGAEANFDWLVGGGVRLNANGGFTNATYDRFNPTPTTSYGGNHLEEVPQSSIGAGLVYAPAVQFEFSAAVTRYGKMWYDSANTLAQDPYTLVNVSAAYQFRNWRFSVLGRNLLDEHFANRGLVSGGKAYIHAADPANVLGQISFSY